MKDTKEICNECGESVKFGSGNYVNRVPDLNDTETRLEMGKPFPNGEWICSKCNNENTFQLSQENAEPSVTISYLCKIWMELYGEDFKKQYRGIYKHLIIKGNEESDKMLSFQEFCNYFEIDTSFVYVPIVDAYIQYQHDFANGGYVSPDKYYSKK